MNHPLYLLLGFNCLILASGCKPEAATSEHMKQGLSGNQETGSSLQLRSSIGGTLRINSDLDSFSEIARLSQKDRDTKVSAFLDAASHHGIRSLVQAIKQLPSDGNYEKCIESSLGMCAILFPDQVVSMVQYLYQEVDADRASSYTPFLLANCHSTTAIFQLSSLPIPLEDRSNCVALMLDGMEGRIPPSERLSLVERIENAELRNLVRSSYAYIITQFEADYQTAIKLLETNPPEKLFGFSSKLSQLPNTQELFSAISSSNISNKDAIIAKAFSSWLMNDLNAGLEWLNTVENVGLKDELIANGWRHIAKEDQDAAGQWIAKIQNKPLREQLRGELSQYLTR